MDKENIIDPGIVIAQTKKWIAEVVIGCNFCPFAANVWNNNSIYYQIEESIDDTVCLYALLQGLKKLDADKKIATSFLIFPNGFQNFTDYLDFVTIAENLLLQQGYEGIYQIASFHPLYRFAGSTVKDPANFTNKSIYPMLHILREELIEQALQHFKNPENIPEKNIFFAREKGLLYMKMLRDECYTV